jgi:hypothetical protein
LSRSRALTADLQLLILDEPTSALTPAEAEKLFRIVRALRAEDKSVLLITHRLEELDHIADDITVLRDGAHVATRPAKEVDRSTLIQMMVGRPLETLFAERKSKTAGREVLRVENLGLAGTFANVSFSVSSGEIVGMAGDMAVKARHGRRDRAVERADQIAHILGIEPRRQRSRADEIAEHHRQLTALGWVLRLRLWLGGRPIRERLAGGKLPDRAQHLQPVPERNTEVFEGLLITACSQASEARRHMPEHERRDFTLYVDEFQNFATESFASILSEARKWRLSLVAANQQIAQLPEALQHAVFGNAGTLVVFRVGAHDAKRLAGELGMSSPATLTQTNNHRAWIQLMRNGAPLEPRLIATLAPPPPGARLAKVIAFAHACHMMPRGPVEERIAASFPKAPAKRPRHRGKRDADR